MTNKDYVLSLFKKWQDNTFSDSDLIDELEVFNSGFSGDDIWFRFFKNDTMVTTIRDIENDLKDQNRNYRIECIDMALKDADNFQLNYD